MERRDVLRAAMAALFGPALAQGVGAAVAETAEGGEPFDFDVLVAKAEAASRREFREPLLDLAEPFAELTYDSFRAIRFREEELLWGDEGERFAVDLMPPGFYFRHGIRLNIVRNGDARELPFSTAFFHFHPRYFPYGEDGRAPEDLARDHGFSGFRLRHPLNRAGVWDEVAVFQGASYFRAVARDTLYGLSARGLAIGSGEPEPEEFPLFTDFWIEEPGERDEVTVYALLDSPSVAGAYAITIRPGDETEMNVRSALFPRVEIDRVGIAPLTSMYFFGPERRAGVDDFRDAVHDSNALQIVNGQGETLWRPLANPPTVQFSFFQDENPRAFGLIQRPRSFDYYQDGEARYEMRPSAWVEPEGDWGAGAVVLVEIPTRDEFADNMVAFWRPEAPLAAGARHDFAYRLTWGRDHSTDESLARVLATRSGLSILDERERVFVIDFDLGGMPLEGLEPRLAVSDGEIVGTVSLSPLPGSPVARVGFHHLAGEASSAEFRLEIVDADARPVSEVWLYRWLPS